VWGATLRQVNPSHQNLNDWQMVIDDSDRAEAETIIEPSFARGRRLELFTQERASPSAWIVSQRRFAITQ
jgi:hypothetical protein